MLFLCLSPDLAYEARTNIGLKKAKYQKRICFWLSAQYLKDISYNSDSCETLDMVHVKYVLLKGVIYVQNRRHLCPKNGLNLAKKWLFASVIQDTNVIVGLKLLTTGTNVTTVLCT